MTTLKVAGVVVAIGLAAALSAGYSAFGAFLPWNEDAEVERLALIGRVLPGQTVAEIGAGTGRFTAAMARKVGSAGKVYATELNPDRRRAIHDRVVAAGLQNVTILEAAADATNLPDACCDMVFLRNVYHHIQEPERFAASIARAVKPDGSIVIIDFEPGVLWLHGATPDGANRRPGHGVPRQAAIAELRTAGFELRHDVPTWSGPMWMVALQRAGTGANDAIPPQQQSKTPVQWRPASDRR